MQYRRFQAEKLTAIGKRIRCNVQNTHDFGRLAKVECSTAGFPDHGLRHASDGGCLDGAIKILLLRSAIWSSEPEEKNALAKIHHISRVGPIGLIRFSCWREYAPRIETKLSDTTKKGRRFRRPFLIR